MISIVIPTYARPSKVVEAVKSVQKQTFSDIEILIIDDNGRNSQAQIETEEALKAIHDERLRYIIHDKNKGGCAARNTGIINGYGEYVAFLDDDDVWSEKFLETMLPFFNNDKVGAVYCDYYSYDGIYSLSTNSLSYEGDVYNDILGGWCPASTSFFVVKKSMLIAAGLFDEKLRSFQDYDMWLRLSKFCEFAHCKERLVVKFEGFDEQTSKNPARRWAGYHGVVEKYTQILSKDELSIFQNFIDNFYYSTLLGDIVYNHAHIRLNIRKYLKRNSSLKKRLSLYLRLWLPKRVFAYIYVLVKAKMDNTLVIYKGLYKFGGGGAPKETD